MKTIVSYRELSELEIRPAGLQDEFRALTAEALRGLRCDEHVDCPGCGSARHDLAFEKLGMRYRECARCESLFVSPRPAQAELDRYYRVSAPARFWRERLLPATGPVRAEKIARPRAEWVADGIAEHSPGARSGVDISSSAGPFLAALVELMPRIERMVAASPTADLDLPTAIDRVEVRAGPLQELGRLGPVDLITAFDVLDRQSSVDRLMTSAAGVLVPGGLLFLTATAISGFDLQALWDRSNTIAPPEKLNLLSIDGLLAVLRRGPWVVRELSTPGVFDAEAVRRAIRADPGGPWPRAVRRLLEKSGDEALEAFQEFLQRYRLGSFARVLAQKV